MRIQASFGGHLNLDGFKRVGGISPDRCSDLSFAELAGCNITSISSSILTYVGGIWIQNQLQLKSISLPLVTSLGRDPNPDDLVLNNLPALEAVNLSLLEYAHTLDILNVPKLSTLEIPSTGRPAIPITYPDEDPLLTFYARIKVVNSSLENLDFIFRNKSRVCELNIEKNPNVKSVIIHNPAEEATITGNGELELTYNLTSPQEPWLGSLWVTGLSKFQTDGVKNVSGFAVSHNKIERLDVEFSPAFLRIQYNENLASLCLHEVINGTVYIFDSMLNLTFPTGPSATPDQETGYWQWPNLGDVTLEF